MGDVTVIVDCTIIVNVLLLPSVIVASAVSEILTRQFEDDTFGMVHLYEPVAAEVLAVITFHDVPLSVVYSSFTFVTPDEVQVMLCDVLAVNDSPPLGDVTVIVGGGDIVKEASLVSVTYK